MPYTPQVWVDDDTTKPVSAARLSVMEAGIEDADNRITVVAGRVFPPQEITYAATITPDALTGSVFYCVATGDLTLNQPANGVDGKYVTVAIQASGGIRTVSLPDASSVQISPGEWWAARMLYLDGPDSWLLTYGV